VIRRNNEAQTASETNSTNDVGPAPGQAGYQLDCTEISTRLRTRVKKYINTFDQSALMREINEAFYKQNEDLTQ
jgi:hypothetical protein